MLQLCDHSCFTIKKPIKITWNLILLTSAVELRDPPSVYYSCDVADSCRYSPGGCDETFLQIHAPRSQKSNFCDRWHIDSARLGKQHLHQTLWKWFTERLYNSWRVLKNRTCGPAITMQRSNQLSYRVQLASSNHKFMYIIYWGVCHVTLLVNIMILLASHCQGPTCSCIFRSCSCMVKSNKCI